MTQVVDDFIKKVNAEDPRNAEENAALNQQWATLKATLPTDQKDAAEAKVRAVLNK